MHYVNCSTQLYLETFTERLPCRLAYVQADLLSRSSLANMGRRLARQKTPNIEPLPRALRLPAYSGSIEMFVLLNL